MAEVCGLFMLQPLGFLMATFLNELETKMTEGKKRHSLQHFTNLEEETKIPDGCGLLLRLNDANGEVQVEYEDDGHYANIHPNCYAPGSLKNVVLLHGGGSGTAVFAGHHPLMGKVIMKHASPTDTEEVMSLGRISKELISRGKHAPEAADFLKSRIPRFLFCYISPYHVRDRGLELWNTLRNVSWREFAHEFKGLQMNISDSDVSDDDENDNTEVPDEEVSGSFSPGYLSDCAFQIMKAKRAYREIWITKVPEKEYSRRMMLQINTESVVVHFPELRTEDCVVERGFDFLTSFTYALAKQQVRRTWKCTLAQSSVGGPQSENGAAVLVSGRLKGVILERTIKDFIQVMYYLRELSKPSERGGIAAVREEVQRLEETQQTAKHVDSVSRSCNEYVGTAIRKNFMPRTGRFPRLREFGTSIQKGKFVLTDEERIPSMHLGKLLNRGCKMQDVFADCPFEHCALDHVEHSWFEVLKLAVSFDSEQVNDCIWTCGLTDAGLHNTFVDKARGLELFDLGAPQLMPMPAFLTKFLMSFFHALGMEEGGNNNNHGTWVCRFEQQGGWGIVGGGGGGGGNRKKLCLTRRTKSLLPYIHSNFSYTMDRLIREVFEGDDRVRELLLTYTILQLLSDASFCLERWEQKGGGRERVNDWNKSLGKWLWRCLWDLYIATDVYETLLRPIKAKKLQNT